MRPLCICNHEVSSERALLSYGYETEKPVTKQQASEKLISLIICFRRVLSERLDTGLGSTSTVL